mgnify:CR=1 FL=1|jgi:hypothetical protein
MYGKWVTVNLGEGIECKVFVLCTPTTPDDVLQRLAINTLRSRLPEKKTGLAAGMEAISIISDWECSQGRGARFEAEKELERLIAKLQ